PHALAAGELESNHAAALADGEDLAAVYDGVGVDVRKSGDAGRNAGARQRVAPDLAPVLVTVGVELARREAGDHGARDDRRRGRAKDAGDFESRGAGPVGRAVAFFQRIEL